MSRPIFYMAHPYGGKPENLERAKRWLRWLINNNPYTDFTAPWIPWCETLPDLDPFMRERGIAFDLATVSRCDGLVLVGGRISRGMQLELEAATRNASNRLPVINLTMFGEEPPR